MKLLKYIVAITLFFNFLLTAQTKWVFDKAHTKISFSVSHMVINEVEGNFKSFDGSLTTNKNDFTDAKIKFTVDVNSINTDNSERDKHLKSDDFFNAKKYPKMVFVSKSLKKISGKKYKMVGDLTIRDKTKEIVLDVKFNGTIKDPWGNIRAGFSLEGEINRFDYNLKWSKLLETGGLVVGKTVTILGKVELIKQK